MKKQLQGAYSEEKHNLIKLLVGSRMIEISYNETFKLLFRQDYAYQGHEAMSFLLTLDTTCWFGDRTEWLAKVEISEKDKECVEKEECQLAYELTRLRYNNLIEVEKVEFFDEFFSVVFSEGNTLSIAYYAESDYSWFLEEVSAKPEHERLVIGCQGTELFQNNIPTDL